MKKFQFALDTVLEYRRQALDAIQIELAALSAQTKAQAQALEDARNRLQKTNAEYRSKQAAGMTVAEARGYETALLVAQRDIRREQELLLECQKKEEAKRQETVAAKQDVSSVEKLREKKLEEYRQDEQKGEERFIDDLESARIVRRATS